MQASDWNNPADGVLGCLIGQPGRSKTPLLLLVNPEANDRMFVLPTGSWRALLDTSMTEGDTPALQTATSYPLRAHSLALLQSVPRKG